MSDPWIKVYPADMRGDPKLDGMNADLQLALIHAWDLAKNGPGAIAELRASDGRAMTEKELRRITKVSGSATRRMFERWASRDLCVLVDDGGQTLVTFPDLAKRQGIDATAAERKRRERERRRHGNVTPMSRQVSRSKSRGVSRHVTGENQIPDIEKTPPDPPSVTEDVTRVWEAYAAHHPKTPRTVDRVQRIQRRLRDFDADTLIAAIDGNHLDPHCNGENDRGRQYHDLGLILRNADTIERYAAIKREANGNGSGDHYTQWTREDFLRIAAEREAREAQEAT